MSVKIIIDPYHINTETLAVNCFEVEDEQDYIQARRKIKDALNSKSELFVVVYNVGMTTWFDDFSNGNQVELKKLTPADELKRVLGASDIPFVLREDENSIVELGLLSQARRKPLKKEQSVIDWVLFVTLGGFWSKDSIETEEDIKKLLQWYINEDSPSKYPVISKIQADKVKSWLQKEATFSSLLQWIFEDVINAKEKAELFVLGQLLRRYPEEEQAKWLQEDGRWSILSQLKDREEWFSKIPLISAPNKVSAPALNTQIRNYLKSELEKKGLEEVLSSISGELASEADAIKACLEDEEVIGETSSKVLKSVEKKFESNPKAVELIKLISYIEPKKTPPKVDRDWTWEQVKLWLKDEYLPYYDSLACRGKVEGTIEFIEAFEEWLIFNYSDLIKSLDALVYGIKEEIDKLKERGPVLLIVIEALGWNWFDFLLNELYSKGFFAEIEPHLRLAVAPSVTKISKSSLVRGQLPVQFSAPLENSSDFYFRLFREAYSSNEKTICCSTDGMEELSSLLIKESDAYLFLANKPDGDIVHKSFPNEIERRRKFEKYLYSLIEEIATGIQKYEDYHRGSLTVIITGDHGYTVLPKSAKGIVAPDSEHAHHGRVYEGKLQEDSNNFFVIESSIGKLDRTYTVTRGYNYFNPKPHGAVHGGITPQELAVPVIIFSRKGIREFHEISINIEGEIRRGLADNPILVRFSNPNRFSVNIKDVSLHLVDLKTPLPIRIPPQEDVTLDAIFNASKVEDLTVEVFGEVSSEGLGRKKDKTVRLELQTIGAAVISREFEDEFEI